MVAMVTTTMSLSLTLSILILGTIIEVVGVRVNLHNKDEPHVTPLVSISTDHLCPNPMYTDVTHRHGVSRRRHHQGRDERKQKWVDVLSFTLPVSVTTSQNGGRWGRELFLEDLAVSNSSDLTISHAMNPVTVDAVQVTRRRWEFDGSRECLHFFLFTTETNECAYGLSAFRPRLKPEKFPVRLIFPDPLGGHHDDDGDDETEFDPRRSTPAYHMHLIFKYLAPESGRCELIVQEYKMSHNYLTRYNLTNKMEFGHHHHHCPTRTRSCGSYSCTKFGHAQILNQLDIYKTDVVLELEDDFLIDGWSQWDRLRHQVLWKRFLTNEGHDPRSLTCRRREVDGGVGGKRMTTTSKTDYSTDNADYMCGGSKTDQNWSVPPNLVVFAASIFLFVLFPIHFFHRIRGRPEQPPQVRRSTLPNHPSLDEAAPSRTEENGRPHSRECRSNYFPIRTDPSRRPQFECDPPTPTPPMSPHVVEVNGGGVRMELASMSILNEMVAESPPPPYALCEPPTYEEAVRMDKKT